MDKKLKTLLIVSLALNLFLVGFMAGGARHFMKPQRHGMERVMKDFMKSHNELRTEIERERNVAFDMLKADKFDQAKFMAQIDRVARMQQEMFRQFSLDFAEKVRKMPTEERVKFLEKMQDRRHGMRGHVPEMRKHRS